MPKLLDDKLANIESLIRQANGEEAKIELLKLRVGNIPDSKWAEVASLAKRVGLADFALTLLRPLVRPGRKLLRAATEKECEAVTWARRVPTGSSGGNS